MSDYFLPLHINDDPSHAIRVNTKSVTEINGKLSPGEDKRHLRHLLLSRRRFVGWLADFLYPAFF